MPRGITPRQPSRSGRQDKASSTAKRAKERISKSLVENPLDEKPVEWLTCIFEAPPKQNRH